MGIAGFIDPRGFKAKYADALAAMGVAIAHRGPDDAGIWVTHTITFYLYTRDWQL